MHLFLKSEFKLVSLLRNPFSNFHSFIEYCKENKIANFPLVRYYFKGQHIEDIPIDDSSTPEVFLNFLQQKSQRDEL